MRQTQALTVDYRVMMDSSPDSVLLLDLERDELVHANRYAAELFGMPVDAFPGTPFMALCPAVQPNGIPSRTLFDQHIQQVLDGHIVGFPATLSRRDGHAIACEVRMIMLPIGGRRLLHVRVVDITQRNMADRLRVGQGRLLEMVARGAPLTDTLDQLMLLIESQSEGVLCSVLLLNEDGVTIHPASAPSLPADYMAALDGFSIGPTAGSCGTAMFRKEIVIVPDILHDPLWAPYTGLVAQYGLRACWSTPIYLDREQVLGSFAMYYREVRSPTLDDMRLISVATHLAGIAIERTRRERELTQHRAHLEELVAARTAELTDAQNELTRRDKLAALGALVAGVAHELNTPLGNSLVVATTMVEHAAALEADLADGLRRSTLDTYLEHARQANAILIRNLQRAAALVSSFKQLAVDQSSAQRSRFSLSELVAELALPLRLGVGKRPITIELDIAEGLSLDSFPGLLTQTLNILLDNCLVHAFSAEASGTIRMTAAATAPEMVSIAVADTGCGIAPEAQGRVYDPFFTTRMGAGGSGLGLHVAHNIVTGVLGGRIELVSVPGAGSTFSVLLPTVAPGFLAPH